MTKFIVKFTEATGKVVSQSGILTTGMVGAKVTVNCCPAWEGLTRTAVFRTRSITRDVVNVGNDIPIPAEVLQEVAPQLHVGLYGTDASGSIVLPTVWINLGPVQPGANPSGDPSTDPELPVWAQLAGEVSKYADIIQQGEGSRSVVLNGRTSTALDDRTHASGYSTRAGGKGFLIVSASADGDGTGTYTLSSTTGISVGDEYSVRLDKPLHKAGKILLISGKQVKVDGYVAIDRDPDEDEINPSNYLTILGRPDLGDVHVGAYAHAEGEDTRATERASHAEGRETWVIGQYGHAEGRLTTAAYAAHSEGRETEAIGNHAHAEGFRTGATGDNAHAEGYATQATNKNTHAEGNGTKASGIGSHAEGFKAAASGDYAHSEGTDTEAKGHSSHAEGNGSIAYTQNSHAEGESTKAGLPFNGIANNDRRGCHAEGVRTVAVRVGSHAEGVDTRAEGQASHAEGQKGYALGKYSHAEGYNTIARGEAQHVAGKYNVEDTEGKYAHILGAGTSATNCKNIHTVDWDGNAFFAGILSAANIPIEDEENPGCYYRMVGDEKEWVNPPMVPGTEYRTMERRNGKVVYTIAYDTGPSEEGGYVEFDIVEFAELVNFTGVVKGRGANYSPLPSYFGPDGHRATYFVDIQSTFAQFCSDDQPNSTVDNIHFQMWYTKE